MKIDRRFREGRNLPRDPVIKEFLRKFGILDAKSSVYHVFIIFPSMFRLQNNKLSDVRL